MTSFALRGLDGSGYFELPDYKDFTAAYEFSDISALTLNYPVNGVNASRLAHLVQVMLLVDGVEADNSRWLLKAIGGDEDNVSSAVLNWTARSIVQVFEGAIVLGSTPSTPTAVPFVAKTPGEILKTLINQAQARGALTGITHATFSNTLDSNGIAWGTTYTQTYDPYVKYIDILRDLVNKGLIEFKMVGLDLRVYKVDTMGTDRTTLSPAVTLRSGIDFSETPFTSTVDAYVSDVYVTGDNGSLQIRTGASSHPFGKQEDSLSVGGTADSGSLILAGDAELAARRRTRVEKTRGLKFSDETQFWPLVDYKVSDYIYQQSAGISEKIRIRSLTVQGDQSGAKSGSIVLNDKFVEEEIKTARALTSILGGSTSGSPNAPGAGTDTTIPNAPTVASVASLAFTQADGTPASVVTVTVTPPSTNTDTSAFSDLAMYMIRWRYADAAAPPNPGEWQQVQGSQSNVVSFSPVRNGVNIEVQALVSDTSNHLSAWSASTSHTTTSDSTPPPVPINVSAIAFLGSLKIIWDGTFTGPVLWTNRPTDFRFCEVHVGTISGFTPDDTTRVANLFGPGNVSVPALTYGVTYYVKLKSVDSYGNKSAASSVVSAVPQLAQAGDIDPSVLADLTSDPVFVQYFGTGDGVSGWASYSGAGSLSWFLDTLAPTVPGVLRSTNSLKAEWQGSLPMPYDPEAVYNFRGRFKIKPVDIALDGNFALGTNAQWDTFWSGTVTAVYTGNTGKLTSTGAAQNAVLRNKGTNSTACSPGDMVRVSGKVRTSGAASSNPYVEIVTNTASVGAAVYFTTGAVVSGSDSIGPSTTFVNFSSEFIIPAGDDCFNIYLRDILDNTEWVEWDDIVIQVFSADISVGMIGYKADRTTAINPDNVGTDKSVIHAAIVRTSAVIKDDWLDYDCFISGRSDGASQGDGSTANTAVSLSEQARYWRPAFIYNATTALEVFDIDWFQIDRIKANIAIPGAIIASQVNTTSLSTENAVISGTFALTNNGAKPDYVLTALDESGAGTWMRPQATVTVGAVQPGGQLLLPEDSKFEDATVGSWVATTNCTIQNNAGDTGPSGAPSRSLRMTATAAGNAVAQIPATQQYKAKEGDVITASASVISSAAKSVRLDVVFLSAANGVLRTDTGTAVALSAATWGTAVNTVALAAPSGTAAVTLTWTVLSANASQTANITNVRLISDQTAEPEDPRIGDQWFDVSKDFSEFIVMVVPTDTTARNAANNTSTWTALNSTFETFNIDIPCNGVLEIDYGVWLKVGATAGTIEFNLQVKTATGCTVTSLDGGTFYANRASCNNGAGVMTSGMVCRGSDVLTITGVDPAVGAQIELRWHFRSNSTTHTYRLPSAKCVFRPLFNDYTLKVVQTT